MKAEFLKRHLVSVLNGTNNEIDGLMIELRNLTRDSNSSQKEIEAITSTIERINILSKEEKFDYYLFRKKEERESSIYRYFGENIYKLISDAYRDYSDSYTFSGAIDKLIDKRKITRERIVSAFFALDEFGVRQLSFKDAPVVVEISLPNNSRSRELETVSQIFSAQARTIKLFEESITGRRSDVEVLAITSSRVSVFFRIAPAIASHFAATVFFLLGAANQYLDAQAKQANLAEILGQAPQLVIDRKIIEAIAEKCASKVADRLDNNGEIAFDFQKCKISNSELLDSIIQGFDYYVHVPNDFYMQSQDESGDSDTPSDRQYEELKQLSEEIRRGFEMRPAGPEIKKIADQSDE
ncbi:MAG: hypothetical protein NXH91_16395 [Phyllobacteriaceae bacterium]|nr:hypothetical protein [Phyllobacteriaceae bacterium]